MPSPILTSEPLSSTLPGITSRLPKDSKRPSSVNVTPLGSHIIQNSSSGFISIPSLLHLHPSGPDAVVHSRYGISTSTIPHSTAPQHQNHSSVWSSAVTSSNIGEKNIKLHDGELKDVTLAGMNSNGKVVDMPVSNLSGRADSGSHNVISDAPHMLQPISNIPSTDTSRSPPEAFLQSKTEADPKARTPAGFVLAGSINLFGNEKLQAKRYVFQGTAQVNGIQEMVLIADPSGVRLEDFFPEADSNSSIGILELGNPYLLYYSPYSIGSSKSGLWMEMDVSFEGSMAPAGEVLKSLFQQPNVSTMHLSCRIGQSKNWEKSLQPTSLTFVAEISNITCKIGGILYFHSVGVGVDVHQRSDSIPPFSRRYIWNPRFFGEVQLDFDGSQTSPLLQYSMLKSGNTYHLSANTKKGEIWENVLGVRNFALKEVQILADFANNQSASRVDLDIRASMRIGFTTISVKGVYKSSSPRADWMFEADVSNLKWADILALYEETFKVKIHLPQYNIQVSELSLRVGSENHEMAFHGKVKIEEYSSVEATIIISDGGISIKGAISELPSFYMLKFETAYAELYIPSQKQSGNMTDQTETTRFSITGTVKIYRLEISATVYFSKVKGEENPHWIVYAEEKGSLLLSDVIPKVKNSSVDFQLNSIAFAACSDDHRGHQISNSMYNNKYNVRKGYQVCAEVQCPQSLAQILRTKVATVTVYARFYEEKWVVEIGLPAPTALSLTPNIKSEEVEVGLQLDGNPCLFVKTKFLVKVDGRKEPFLFHVQLDAGPITAEGIGYVRTDWNNPFGLSPKITVLQPIGLRLKFLYESVTYPEEIEIQGGFMIGAIKGKAVILVSEDPRRGVIKVFAKNIGISELASFVADSTGSKVPHVSSDIFEFNSLDVAISTGTYVDEVYYPRGTRLAGDASVFGEKAKINGEVDAELPGCILNGTVESFSLGLVQITGLTTQGSSSSGLSKPADPVIELALTLVDQHIIIKGETSLFNHKMPLHVVAQLVPFKLSLKGLMPFSDLLRFDFKGAYKGAEKSLKNILSEDFELAASLPKDILNLLVAKINTFAAVVNQVSRDGEDKARQSLQKAKTSYDNAVIEAQRVFTEANSVWERKSRGVEATIDAKLKASKQIEESLQLNVSKTKSDFDALVSSKKKIFEDAQQDFVNSVSNAEKTAAKVSITAAETVEQLNKPFHDAKKALHQNFGNVEQIVQNAEQNVLHAIQNKKLLETRLAEAQMDYTNAEFLFKIEKGLVVAKFRNDLNGAETALKIAEQVSNTAMQAQNSPRLVILRSNFETASRNLLQAHKESEISISSAKEQLETIRLQKDRTIKEAKDALELAQKSSAALKNYQAAYRSLEYHVKSQPAIVEAANSLTEHSLESTAEHDAFISAQRHLHAATSALGELDTALHVVELAVQAPSVAASVAKWLCAERGNFLDIQNVNLIGSLKEAVSAAQTPLRATVKGELADGVITLVMDFVPGQPEQFARAMFEALWDGLVRDVGKYIKL
ncbi:hypothetical protein PVAG01_06225 [Phlyctema vagabunda]|uniref:Uncharacterized protein n=1 Tax=Phlyctema vagabunda TaxID=108571 RepID=A0ABR4PFL0_9HELO